MLAEHGAVAVDDRPRARREAAVALQEVALARPGQEAQVLRVGLARDRQARALGQLAHLRLAHRPEREAQARERVGASAEST